MPRLLIMTLGLRSHLNVSLALADRSRALGYACAVASPNRKAQAEVESEGYQYFRLAVDGTQLFGFLAVGRH